MTHLTHDDLVLHFYGETPAAAAAGTDAHLASCAACHAEFARLQQVLAMVDHQRGAVLRIDADDLDLGARTQVEDAAAAVGMGAHQRMHHLGHLVVPVGVAHLLALHQAAGGLLLVFPGQAVARAQAQQLALAVGRQGVPGGGGAGEQGVAEGAAVGAARNLETVQQGVHRRYRLVGAVRVP